MLIYLRRQDFFEENVLISYVEASLFDKPIPLDRAYIIDFGFSRRLELGPGCQPAIELPHTIWARPREGATHFDPYAWDMLCVGRSFKSLLKVSAPLSYQRGQHQADHS